MLLSLPNELILEIAIYVRQRKNETYVKAKELRSIPFDNDENVPVTLYREYVLDRNFYAENVSDVSQLQPLMLTCRRLREIVYPVYFETLSVGKYLMNELPRLGGPSAAIPKFLEYIKSNPRRAEAVRHLEISENLLVSRHPAVRFYPTEFTKRPLVDRQKEWNALLETIPDKDDLATMPVPKKYEVLVAVELGFTEQRFIDAVEDSYLDMMVVLLLYSLPRLVEFTAQLGSKDNRVRPRFWLEQALVHRRPKCASTLQRFTFSSSPSSVDQNWSPMVWEIMKYPNLDSLNGLDIFPDVLPDEAADAEDQWLWGSGGNLDEIFEISSPAVEVRQEVDPQAIVTASGMLCGCQTAKEHAEMACLIPLAKTSGIKHILLDQFINWKNYLDRVISAPKALETLTLTNGWHTYQERIPFARAILSQAASLTNLEIDFGGAYARVIISKLPNLRKLQVDGQLFSEDDDSYSQVPATEPNKWLPPSLEILVSFCSRFHRVWYKCSEIGEVLATLSPEALPKLKKVSMEAYINAITASEFKNIHEVLAGKGINFEYAFLDKDVAECYRGGIIVPHYSPAYRNNPSPGLTDTLVLTRAQSQPASEPPSKASHSLRLRQRLRFGRNEEGAPRERRSLVSGIFGFAKHLNPRKRED
ncbi:hypothetical protein H072_3469 [Dactylellina haptotyla CBS 200.50]|uniref:F-box domain-containing protein n=1 Tax=Dactylellina haptotyla (strain CBS 200.50) TaxID=1284197 RepID=S8BSU4_DACHA|nr:hypothetical protein H072_3469 [Dactylellina haptotyla CBS 200.50]